jgi:hypothetical protein
VKDSHNSWPRCGQSFVFRVVTHYTSVS